MSDATEQRTTSETSEEMLGGLARSAALLANAIEAVIDVAGEIPIGAVVLAFASNLARATSRAGVSDDQFAEMMTWLTQISAEIRKDKPWERK